MQNVGFDEANGIATLIPNGALTEIGFEYASSVIGPYPEKSGSLTGTIIRPMAASLNGTGN